MYLFFDTETTGLPRNWKAPMSDLANWPRMVQIAWLLYDGMGERLEGRGCIIKPAGYSIPAEATAVHGISTERANKEGEPLGKVLEEFEEALRRSDYLVAHNVKFDEKIVGAEFLRENISHSLHKSTTICTMEKSTNYCRIPGPYGYKWPKLSELHFALFNSAVEETHDANDDVDTCARCFFEMKKQGII